MLKYDNLHFRVYKDDPALIDPAGRIVIIMENGEPRLSAGLSEFQTWDDVCNVEKDRRLVAGVAWVISSLEKI